MLPDVMTHIENHMEKVLAFRRVVENGSIRKAAVDLRISQPALSRTVTFLEEILGVSLLIRSQKGVAPTPEGLILARLGDDLSEAARTAAENLVALRTGQRMSGSINCLCHDVIAGFLWPAVISTTSAAAPALRVSLQTSNSARAIVAAVASGATDFGIGAELPESKSVSQRLIYADTYSLFAAPDSANVDASSVADLDAGSLMFLPQSVCHGRDSLGAEIRRLGYRSPPKYNLMSYEAVIAMAIAGMGIAVLPRRPFAAYVKRQLLAEVNFRRGGSSELGKIHVSCASRVSKVKSHVHEYFLNQIIPASVGRLESF
jgi:DNA-binding transcriptional LysR family regulator